MKKLTLKIISEDGAELWVYNNISTVEFDSLDRGSTSQPLEFGIYSNRGEVSFADIDGAAEDILKNDITGGTKVEIYLSSDIFDKKIGTFRVEDYLCNNNTKIVTIWLKDSLISWQSIDQQSIYFFDPKTALFVLQEIMGLARAQYDVDLVIDENVASHLASFEIYCPHLQPNNLWGNVNKICELTMCRVVENENGVPTIVYDNYDGNPIVIRPHNIISLSNEASKKNTKIPLMTISVKDREKYINADVTPATQYRVYDYDTTVETVEVGGEEQTITRVTWTFVGGDASINPNVSVIEEIVGVDGFQRSARVSFKQNVVGNTYAVTSFSTKGTLHNETDPTVRWENYDRRQEEEVISFDREKGTVDLEFVLLNSFLSGDRALSTAATVAKGKYYVDSEDILYSRSLVDQTYPLSPQTIPSNELLQNHSVANFGEPIPHYVWLTNEISRKYGLGVDCCEVECSFSDYFSEDGEKMIDASGVLSAVQGFSRYDVVIPYIQKGDKTVPYKTDGDGNPKQFKVVGIKYSYNGILRQLLCLQEHIL